jgi:hypothetical protein
VWGWETHYAGGKGFMQQWFPAGVAGAGLGFVKARFMILST